MKLMLRDASICTILALFMLNFRCFAAQSTSNNEMFPRMNTEFCKSINLCKQFVTKAKELSEIKKDLANNNKDRKVVRILSFDGGGTRGYLQCKFLDCLYKQIHMLKNLPTEEKTQEIKTQEISKNNICMNEIFDLVTGTSVGGMNAVGIATGMAPKDMMKFYREKSPWIFTTRGLMDWFSKNASYPSNKPNFAKKIAMIGSSEPLYKSASKTSNYGDARMKKELSDMFGETLLTSIKTPILLTGYSYSGLHPVAFTNSAFSPVSVTIRNVKVVDALMATTAAPIYFPSYPITPLYSTDVKSDSIIDGGLFQNNPSLLAFAQARELFPSAERYCLLSLGTGIKDVGEHKTAINAEQSEVAINKYLNLLNISMYCGIIANDMILQTLAESMQNFYYYRFNFRLDPKRDCSIDSSTPAVFDYLDQAVVREYEKDKYAINRFLNKAFVE